ncbi:hypothetical protein [Mycobacterium intracellulare]|nr:hypothetical protein [Mycobacterium intracellulare]
MRKAFDVLELGRRRTIIEALMTVTTKPVGKDTARVFHPEAADVQWK